MAQRSEAIRKRSDRTCYTFLQRFAWGVAIRFQLSVLSLLLSALAMAQVSEETPVVSPPGSDAPDYYARDTYRINKLVCPFKGRVDYEPGEIECGLLQVPENREDPESRFIELHFVKLASLWDEEEEGDEEEKSALAPGKRDDPVVLLTGGPGTHAEFYVNLVVDHGIRKRRDLYILEQRGVGTSSDFCLTYFARNPESLNVGTLQELSDAALATAEDCATNAIAAGVDLTAYNTIENARDVRAFRMALGYDDWNVWGISYGTLLGQAYIKEDPDGIRAVALDAIVPLDARGIPDSWRTVKWYDRDLRKLDDLCRADPACGRRYPDLGQRVRDAAMAVMEKPIAVPVADTERYPTGTAWILSDLAAFLPFALFYEESSYPALPAIIYAWTDAIAERDETLFRALANAPLGRVNISQGMHNAILCNDGHLAARVVSSRLDREDFPVLTSAVQVEGAAEKYAMRCAEVVAGPRAAHTYSLVETDIPTLLIVGDMDPITPPPLARAIEHGFSNSTYVEFPYAGHGPTRSVDCVGDMLNRFYDAPADEPDTSCAGQMKPPEFIVPLYRTAVVPRIITLQAEDKDALPSVAAWGLLSVVPVVLGLIVLTIAPLGRRIDRREAVPSNGARVATWSAAFFGTLALGVLGAAGAASYEISEVLLLFGFVPWARIGAWAGLIAGLLGLVAVALTIRARFKRRLPIGTLVGFLLTGLGAASLAAFLLYWDLGP
jgi:pimeloyl-ACP methyl ester carboxylesterase